MTDSKFFKKLEKKDTHLLTSVWVTLLQLGNILTMIDIYQIYTNSTIKYNYTVLVFSITIPLTIINTFFLLTEKKYKWMFEHYKEEKYKKLKGWGVFLYIIGSIFLFGYTM